MKFIEKAEFRNSTCISDQNLRWKDKIPQPPDLNKIILQYYSTSDDLPEIDFDFDFDLDDIPLGADFIEPLVSGSGSVSVEATSTTPATTTATATATTTPTSSGGTFSSSRSQQFNMQPEYGKGKEMPNTYVRCGTCSSHFAIRPEDLGERGKGRYVMVVSSNVYAVCSMYTL